MTRGLEWARAAAVVRREIQQPRSIAQRPPRAILGVVHRTMPQRRRMAASDRSCPACACRETTRTPARQARSHTGFRCARMPAIEVIWRRLRACLQRPSLPTAAARIARRKRCARSRLRFALKDSRANWRLLFRARSRHYASLAVPCWRSGGSCCRTCSTPEPVIATIADHLSVYQSACGRGGRAIAVRAWASRTSWAACLGEHALQLARVHRA